MLIAYILTISLLSGLTDLIFYTISSTALTNNTLTSFSRQISPPRQSTSSTSLLTTTETTFPPRRTRNQQTHTFLSYNSFHPRHIKQSNIYCQFLRHRRICSNDKIFFNDATKIFQYFLSKQYHLSDIHHDFNKVWQIDRHKLLSHFPK